MSKYLALTGRFSEGLRGEKSVRNCARSNNSAETNVVDNWILSPSFTDCTKAWLPKNRDLKTHGEGPESRS